MADTRRTPTIPANDAAARHPVVRALAVALRQRCGVREGDAVLVACSGGADSVALLRALHVLAPRRRWRLRLRVAHVHHHLRDAAERDAAFVEALASRLGLPFERADVDVLHPSKSGAGNLASTNNLEDRARALRYAALRGEAERHGVRHVATAHHADDQLETVLMRLLRGASVHGWRGMPWTRALADRDHDRVQSVHGPQLIRPLLGVDRAALRDFLTELDQPWREDETNADVARLRARLRRDVSPTLRELSETLPLRLEALTDHAGHLSALLDESARPWSLPLNRADARAMNRAVLTEVFRRALLKAGVPADRCGRRALAPVTRAAQDNAGGTRRFAFRGAAVVVDGEVVRLA